MALILARSPYFISKGNLDSGAVAVINIGYTNNSNTFTSLKVYSLTFNREASIDISPLIRDYLDDFSVLEVNTTLNGSIGGANQPPLTNKLIATDGYSYYEDGYNSDLSTLLESSLYFAGSNDVIYRYSDNALKMPFLCPVILSAPSITVDYYSENQITYTNALNFDNNNETKSKINYSIDYTPKLLIDENENEIEDGASNSIEILLDINAENKSKTDKIVLTLGAISKEIKIISITECKYNPNRIIFINRFGVKEDLWFFKKSTETLNVSKESYKANTLNAFASGDFSKHSYSNFNLNGRRSMSLNSGFVPESFKENFKQLMLSEKVWINIDGKELPVSIKNSELELKKSLNDKLINYTIEVEFSYDTINNIG